MYNYREREREREKKKETRACLVCKIIIPEGKEIAIAKNKTIPVHHGRLKLGNKKKLHFLILIVFFYFSIYLILHMFI